MLCIGSWRALGLAAGMVTACSAAWSTDRIAGLELVSPYQQYQVRLHVLLYPPTTAIGLLVKARINGGPLLRLLLDSGAENLVLDRKAAGRAGYRSGTDLDLLGPAAMIRRARLTSARSVAVDDLEFRNVPMVILEGGLVDGIDGVIPLSLFAHFLIHLDGAGKTMVLDPYPSSDRSGVGEFVQAKAQHRLLFLRGLLEGRHDGYLLLDTGSSYNLISHSATDALRLVSGLARSVPLLAAAGKTDGRMCGAASRSGWAIVR